MAPRHHDYRDLDQAAIFRFTQVGGIHGTGCLPTTVLSTLEGKQLNQIAGDLCFENGLQLSVGVAETEEKSWMHLGL